MQLQAEEADRAKRRCEVSFILYTVVYYYVTCGMRTDCITAKRKLKGEVC